MRTEIITPDLPTGYDTLVIHEPLIEDIEEILEAVNTFAGNRFTADDIRHSIENDRYKVNVHRDGYNLYHSCGCCNKLKLEVYKGTGHNYEC